MQSTPIILTAIENDTIVKVYEIGGAAEVVVGRADDCDIRLPSDFEHADVSRHHCRLEIDPPMLHVRDLGSRNGTFLNGVKIGQRQPMRRHDDEEPESPAWELSDGDELRVGPTVFRIGINAAAEAAHPMMFPPWIP